MEIKANDRKVINTQPLDYLFTQGEAGVDRVSIVLPLQYGQTDLSTLGWSIQLVSERDTFISKPLTAQVDEDNLTVFWDVDEDCTAVPGKVKLTIVGISTGGEEVIKFDGREIMIKAAAYGSFAPAPDTLSVALAQVQKYGEEAAFAAEQAVESAAAAEENAQAAQDAVGKGPYIGENGHWFLYDTESKTHLDSGVSSYGAEGKSPYIGTDGYWYQWNQVNGIYQKTEILARGPKGDTGGVASVNGILPDSNGNVEVQAGVASVFGRTGAVTAQEGDYDAGQIDETSSRVFVSPQEKAKWNIPGDIINGTLSVWQRYNADDSTTYTNPDELYVADRFRSNGTGTVKPNARGYGADITGTVTMRYWMEKSDFALLPDPVVVYYSVDGEMQSTSTAKTSVPTDSDGNACIFSQAITNQTLDWVSLYQGRPTRPYAEEIVLCQRYYWVASVTDGGSSNNPQIATGITGAGGYAYFGVHLPTNMRANPTILYSDSGFDVYNGTHNPPTGFFYYGSTDQKKDITLQIKISASTTAGGAAVLQFWQTVGKAYFALDAEIY